MNTKISATAHKLLECMMPARRLLIAGVCAGLLSACHKSPAGNAPAPAQKNSSAAPSAADADAGVRLTPAQIEKIGLETEAAESVDYAPEAAGYGSVIPHESIAQAAAELATAQAAESQSRSALARTRRLAGTAGAMSADVGEANVRQLAVDTAALNLAQQKLTATFGANPPWSGGRNPRLLQALADGSTQLLRVTFPLGSLHGETPRTLSVSRLGASTGDKRLTMSMVWAAPADANVPGRSFFALLRAGEFGEGERVIARTPIGAAQPGVRIPAAAALISEGKYWCYVETMPGNFVRTEIDTGRPVENGYVVISGVKAGDKVVTQAAAQLLAQESNAGQDAD
ncbi:MAG TPA: hypothetical protein VHW71_10750 [Steroidobacteraceae bacterium]|jgi:multidrug efflux pump subunit AcrA (membrane-fusion protein)|nr:hypothetical protein [Steroidobacteraceae bacterium]